MVFFRPSSQVVFSCQPSSSSFLSQLQGRNEQEGGWTLGSDCLLLSGKACLPGHLHARPCSPAQQPALPLFHAA